MRIILLAECKIIWPLLAAFINSVLKNETEYLASTRITFLLAYYFKQFSNKMILSST